MNVPSLDAAIADRLGVHGVVVEGGVSAQCAAYLDLLARWNRKINLTALPLEGPQLSSSIDKLVVEPLVAASVAPFLDGFWYDLGSGGGSPAIPMRIANQGGSLVMVESRERKCAFLREAVRTLGLARTFVENSRFESVSHAGDVDRVTVRAVRIDAGVFDLVAGLLRRGGRFVAFGATPPDARFELVRCCTLPDGSPLNVFALQDVPRGTFEPEGLAEPGVPRGTSGQVPD